MKIPLRYQLSEYDCGPTTMLNAIGYLFDRETVPPEVIRNIMLYSLDCYNKEGAPGRKGTSCAAMMFLSHWLDGLGETPALPVKSEYVSGAAVHLGEGAISRALALGGVAVLRLYYDVEHYVLLTGIRDGYAYLFDPYYLNASMQKELEAAGVEVQQEHLQGWNRRAPLTLFHQEGQGIYALGPKERREAVLLFNRQTMLTADKTIEYFI